MYVVVAFSDVVSVIDGRNNTVIQTIPVGEGALRMAFDPTNRDMYVTNSVNNTVSIIKTVSKN
jgi:YVTN family beta-propeller protein